MSAIHATAIGTWIQRAVVLPVSVSGVDNTFSGSDASTYTFSARSFGAEDASRILAVGITAQRIGSPSGVSSVTIGGVSATVFRAQQTGNANDHTTELWGAQVPTGTTGDVVVNFSTAHLRCSIAIFRVLNASMTIPSSNGASVSSGVGVSAAVTVPVNGAAIAVVGNNGNTTYTWSNITEYCDFTNESNAFSAACDAYPAGSSLTATATQASDSSPQALVVVAFQTAG